ncbi:MAG TPA: sigma-54 dependent transcriptional regulator [Vicinamibacterales bacterium]|jgi:DNA-binding NtrC family response regulator
MADVNWTGAAPPKAIANALRAAKIDVSRGRPGSPADSTGGGAKRASPAAPVVVFTPTARRPAPPGGDAKWIWVSGASIEANAARAAVLAGAYAAISLDAADAATQLVARLRELLVPDAAVIPPEHVVTNSEASRRVVAQVARVAPTSMPVLLTGETGTGKEVIARLLHEWSPRRAKRFVPVNCAAIPNELMEAELFGYARGAFSGAVQRYDGQLMAAEGGTVFLDEIDDTPLETQTKLLRVLEDRVVNRLGENVWHEVDFRIVAATNRDLRGLIQDGFFGADLYERLAIVSIHLLPLRERLGDLPALAGHFMARFAREQGRPEVTGIATDALAALVAYPWPGNIRELRNVIYETLVYKKAGTEILLSDLPKRIIAPGQGQASESAISRAAIARKIERGTMSLRDEVAALQRAAIEEALGRTRGNAAQAARLLGEVGRGVARDPGGTLRAMMRRLGDRDRGGRP